jgi:hypothetical protein
MTTSILSPPVPQPAHDVAQPARVSFRQPVSTDGFIDAAWWPRSRDLTVELPPLLDVLWTAAREVTRIGYPFVAWDAAPRRMQIEGRSVRLGGFATGDPLTIRLSGQRGQERIDILVIAPDTDPAVAERALLLASQADDPYRAEEILARAGHDPAISQGLAAPAPTRVLPGQGG